MIKAKTGSGFEWKINENAVNDWEIMEMLAEADDGKVSSLIKALKMIMGEDGYDAIKEHVRDKNGRVAADKMMQEMRELLESARETKNS